MGKTKQLLENEFFNIEQEFNFWVMEQERTYYNNLKTKENGTED